MLFKTRDEAVDYLMGCINYERQRPPCSREQGFKLGTMCELARRLDHPQTAYPVIHIAGTKGKGSTATMIASILRQSGRRVGLYTSPHISGIEERLNVDGQPIDERQFVDVVSEVKRVADQLLDDIRADRFAGSPPTFFELITTAAWLHFRRARVDVAVVEVGLGGRLDSTNICQPRIGVITSISMDHTQQLGSSLTAIAGEKAGIIKPGMHLLSAVGGEAGDVIRHRCQQLGVELLRLDTDFAALPAHGAESAELAPGGPSDLTRPGGGLPSLGGVEFDFEARHPRLRAALGFDRIADLSVPMRGAHQRQNAALAIGAALLCKEFGLDTSPIDIRDGLRVAQLPGRIEILPGTRQIVVDVAHNLAAIEALCQTLQPCLQRATGGTVVVSISDDKDVRAMLPPLLSHFDTLLITAYQENPRAMPAHELAAIARQLDSTGPSGERTRIEVRETPQAALEWLRGHAAANELVCVTGSTFLVSEMRPALLTWSQEPVVAQSNLLASSH